METAVKETDGQAILYGGVPILAVFHSSSAGLTRAAGEVWLNDLPYLQAVESPEETDRIPNYYSRVEFTAAECKEKLLAAFPEADLSGPVSGWLQNAVTDSAGSVETVEVGGVTVKGARVRSALGLRSACFDWKAQDGAWSDAANWSLGPRRGYEPVRRRQNGRGGGGLPGDPDPLLHRRHRGQLSPRLTLYNRRVPVIK